MKDLARTYYMSENDRLNSLVTNMVEYGFTEHENKIRIYDSNDLLMFEETIGNRDELMKRYEEKWKLINGYER